MDDLDYSDKKNLLLPKDKRSRSKLSVGAKVRKEKAVLSAAT